MSMSPVVCVNECVNECENVRGLKGSARGLEREYEEPLGGCEALKSRRESGSNVAFGVLARDYHATEGMSLLQGASIPMGHADGSKLRPHFLIHSFSSDKSADGAVVVGDMVIPQTLYQAYFNSSFASSRKGVPPGDYLWPRENGTSRAVPYVINDSAYCSARGGHAIGLFHEHMRSDREKHVVINWQNIIDSFKENFNKATDDNYGVPYDYMFIMHYQGRGLLGRTEELTHRDKHIVNLMYGCISTWCVYTVEAPQDQVPEVIFHSFSLRAPIIDWCVDSLEVRYWSQHDGEV
ncbi:hypothetical protein O3P69_013767 [Scylla paramamosain]|uniref:Metalloendopeptidase n=1 Tax=Scylla paramamosain TaxID=85552 RepID=A0AAW0SQJ5_SCYPA